MSGFLDSLKSDLLDRRVTPVLALLVAAVLGAAVYAAIGGGSSSSTTPAGAPAASPSTTGIAVSAVQTDSKSPASETTSGASEQTGGASRNPFSPTASAKTASSTKSASSGSGASATTGSATTPETTESSSTGGGSEEPSSSQTEGSQRQEQQPSTGKQQKTYRVSVLFGVATPGTPALEAGLTSYDNLKRQQPLPSAEQPVIVFRGVVVGAKSATFTLVGEAIPHGEAVCRPSPSQCQAIDLKVGQTEELEYVPLGGTPVSYQLKLVSIKTATASASASSAMAGTATVAHAAAAYGGESRAGVELLRREGLTKLPGLRYSRNGSVLVFVASDHALAARARAAAWGATARG
jgi:hypothetical protein